MCVYMCALWQGRDCVYEEVYWRRKSKHQKMWDSCNFNFCGLIIIKFIFVRLFFLRRTKKIIKIHLNKLNNKKKKKVTHLLKVATPYRVHWSHTQYVCRLLTHWEGRERAMKMYYGGGVPAGRDVTQSGVK